MNTAFVILFFEVRHLQNPFNRLGSGRRHLNAFNDSVPNSFIEHCFDRRMAVAGNDPLNARDISVENFTHRP